jgi:hypothetical protein
MGSGERKHAPTSVPPDKLMMGHRPPPTSSISHRYGSGFHGSPVDAKMRRVERSCERTGSVPLGMSARMSVGETPSAVTPWRSTVAHNRSGPGWFGAPSVNSTVEPSASAPTISHGPMIQPRSVTQCSTSPGRTSVWYATSSAIFTRNPACTCSTPFGLPVVPLV